MKLKDFFLRSLLCLSSAQLGWIVGVVWFSLSVSGEITIGPANLNPLAILVVVFLGTQIPGVAPWLLLWGLMVIVAYLRGVRWWGFVILVVWFAFVTFRFMDAWRTP